MRRSVCADPWIVAVSLTLFCSLARANNPYGIMTRHSGGHDSIWCGVHLQQARDLSGEWGYTRTGGGPGNEYATRRNLIMHRAKRLIPIVNVSSHDSAAAVAGFVQTMSGDGYRMPYLEIGNEPQGGWSAADYAAHLLDVCQTVKAVEPTIKIMNGGFAGSGSQYLDDMLTAVPDLVDELDIVCCHPYAINYPPDDTRGFLGYLDTVAVMDAHGFTGPIAFTEFGYELGNQGNPAFPKITEELRATYMVDIFQNYIEQDPRILAACPFILGDQLWNGWALWDWVRFDRTTTAQFDAIAALEKPAGEDYLASGSADLQGTVIDPGLATGVEGVFVYLLPGPYAAETEADGSYAIENIPAGTYTACLLKDGYQSPDAVPVEVSAGMTMDFVAPRLGVFHETFDFEASNGVPSGWGPADGQSHPEIFSIDVTTRHSGWASQRINAGGPMMWKASNYNSVFTGEVWHAEMWVRTEGLTGAGREGAYLRIDFRDNHFSFTGNSSISTGIIADQDWAPLAMTFVVPQSGRRMQVIVGCDADSGNVWFDDMIIDRADLPLPTWAESASGRLVEGWNLMSVPMRPRDPRAEAVLDELAWAGMSITDNLYRYQSGTGYETYPGDFSTVEPERGYWLELGGPTQEVVPGHRITGDVRIPLDSGWNLVGYPFDAAQAWSNCRVSDGVSELSIADAAVAGWIQSKAYYYEDGYRLVGLAPPVHDAQLRPWYGYYVRAFRSGLELIVPDPTGAGTLQGTVVNEFAEPVEGAVISATPGGYWALSEGGNYEVTGIPAGTYDVRVTAPEYVTQTAAGQVITADEVTQLDFVLEYITYPSELENPGFEEGEALPGWTRFGVVDGQQSGPWYGDIMPHSGDYFLGSASNYSGNDGGVYQKVSVTPGVSYTASVWVAVYWTGGTPEERGCRIGVDPTGDHDPESANIVWSDWSTEQSEWTWSWKYVEVGGISATTPRSLMTVYLEQKQRAGGIWNITCFDDVGLVAEESGAGSLGSSITMDASATLPIAPARASAVIEPKPSAAAGLLSYCAFAVQNQNPGDWTGGFLAVIDDGASDGYVPGEDLAFIAPPGRGVAMLSQPAGASEDMLLDARDGSGDQEWWGGDASGPNQTLYLERFGYEAGDPAAPVVMTWDLQGASGWRYTLYDDSSGQWIKLVSGADYAVDVPAGGVTLRLFAEGGPPPVPPDFDGDNDVDQEDFGHLQVCLTGSGITQDDPDCQDARLDDDDDVDQNDCSIFQGCMSGPNVPFDPGCKN